MINEKRLIKTFIELVKIDSESRREKKVADYIVKKIKKLGLKYTFDKSQKRPVQMGNLIIYKKSNNDKKTLYYLHIWILLFLVTG